MEAHIVFPWLVRQIDLSNLIVMGRRKVAVLQVRTAATQPLLRDFVLILLERGHLEP